MRKPIRYESAPVGTKYTVTSKRYGTVVLCVCKADGPVNEISATKDLTKGVTINEMEQAILILHDNPPPHALAAPLANWTTGASLSGLKCGVYLCTSSSTAMVAEIESVEYTGRKAASDQIASDVRGQYIP